MYGFSEPLFGTILTQPVAGIPTNNGVLPPLRDSMFDMNKGRDIWYTIKDGNWNDITIWRTVGGRRKDFPQVSVSTDDVYIRHSVTLNTSTTVNNCFVSGTLQNDGSARTFLVQGNLQVTGTFDIKSVASVLGLYGNNNFINTFVATTNSTIQYLRQGEQDIMDLPYWNLTINGIGNKNFTSDITVGNIFNINPPTAGLIVNFFGFNLTVTGTTAIGIVTIRKSGLGTILFTGLVTSNSNSTTWDVNGSTVEYRNGINFGGAGTMTYIGVMPSIIFTTNNQTITTGNVFSTATFGTCNVTISGAITLTVVSSGAITNSIRLSAPINGDNAASTLVNKATIDFFTVASMASMTTGVFDFATFPNIMSYSISGAATLPYTTFSGLAVANIGTKTLAGNTTIATTLSVVLGVLDCSTYDLTVNTTTSCSSSGSLSKTGAGNVLLIGAVSLSSSSNINFSGNPTVELRGGLTFSSSSLTTGTGVWTFSTNSQTISIGASSIVFACPILISGAITLTTAGTVAFSVTGTINGNNAASTLDNRNTGGLGYQNTTAPMLTGVLTCNAAVNTWLYNKAGAQDVQGGTTHLTTAQYWHLTLSVSGAKTLQGNVSVLNTYTLSGTATKNNNGFTFGNP